jgi:transposase InsO family protein
LAKVPGQFARWLEQLNAFTFDVKVRAGTSHVNADFVSRIFGDCFCKTREIFEKTESAREALKNEPVLDWALFDRCAAEVAARRVRSPSSEILKIMDGEALKMLRERDLDDQLQISTKISPEERFEKVKQRVVKEKQTHGNEMSRPKLRPYLLRPPKEALTTRVAQPHWTKEEMEIAQAKDPDLKLIYEAKRLNKEKPSQVEASSLSEAGKAYMRDWSLIEMRNGLLYRYYEDATRSQAYWRLMIPQEFQQEIVEKMHSEGIACHQGYQRTVANLKLRYEWHGMRDQVRIYTRACAVCQRTRTRNINTRHQMTGHLAGYRGERVNMDVCGPFTLTPLGNKYLLVICDSFTRYVAAVPVPDTRATTLCDAFVRGWCHVYGYPTEIHTDHGTYFTSEFWKEMCEKLHLKHTLGSALRPQSNGQNERQIRAVQESLRVAINGHRKTDWDVRISYATAAYNFTPNATTKFTPHELMFGQLPQMEIDFIFDKSEETRSAPAEFLKEMLLKMSKTFEKVRENLRATMELRKERYDGGIRTKKYKIGETVALKTANKLVGNDKLADKFIGPYYIISIWDNGAIRIKMSAKSAPKIVHMDRVEPWIQAEGATEPNWLRDAIKQFAPEKQEVGVQVSFDLQRGEVIAVRSAPALNFSLTPVKLHELKGQICAVCEAGEYDKAGIRRSFTIEGNCHICHGTPKWHRRSQKERYELDEDHQKRKAIVESGRDLTM